MIDWFRRIRCSPTRRRRGGGDTPAPAVTSPVVSTQSNFAGGAYTLPTNASGDLMVLFVCGDPLDSVSGWTQRQSRNGGGLEGISCYTKESTGSEATVNIDVSTGNVGVVVYVFAAKDYDTSGGTSTSGSGTFSNAPDVTATTASGILVCAWGINNTANDLTVPGTMTAGTHVNSAGDSSNVRMRTAYEQLSASGATGTRQATFASSFRRGEISLIVK